MARRARLNWRGRQVLDNVMDAARAAVDETTTDCVRDSQGLAPTSTRGNLNSRPAQRTGTTVSGRWGAYDHPNARHIIEVERGSAAWPARPYLRPSSDRNYPQLVRRIRSRMGR